MKILSKMFGLCAVFCACGAADAALRAGGASSGSATGRVSIATPGVVSGVAAARRIPVMSKTATTAATTSNASLMATTECVDSYSECIKGEDACGSNFEECTTAELFYAQMPKCNSVLMQCASAGVNALFGTSSMTYLTVENMNAYPTAGSIIGQYIAAGEISNRLDTGKCVQTYLRCLHKDSVCGEDFELCTDAKEFKKQKVYCESTLARCQDEGKKELFGTTDTTSYAPGSRLDIMVNEGADLAAANAVATCYKNADQCILSACAANPFACIEDTNKYLIDLAAEVTSSNDRSNNSPSSSLSSSSSSALNVETYTDAITKKEIMVRMRNACLDKIGGNKYCHMTVKGGVVPTKSELQDEFERDSVFEKIYASRKKMVADKLADLRNEFDKGAKDKCAQTIASCAARTCGEGIGSACYELAFKTGNVRSINNPNAREAIKSGCEMIVNADTNCQYAAAASTDGMGYIYAYNYKGEKTFDTLFPERKSKSDTADPIMVIAALNQSLQERFNDAAIANMAKQCKTTVESCIRSQCGADFAKCYRNRTDIMSDTYSVSSANGQDNSGWNQNFANSMNKVSGILDFTIIRGLCGSIVKNSAACEEHLNIQAIKSSKQTGSGVLSVSSSSFSNVATTTSTNLK